MTIEEAQTAFQEIVTESLAAEDRLQAIVDQLAHSCAIGREVTLTKLYRGRQGIDDLDGPPTSLPEAYASGLFAFSPTWYSKSRVM